ncbi:MAG: TRAP transporter small permease [Bacteroidota bacterium]
MKFLKAIDSGFAKIESGVVVLFLSVMILMAFFQVVLRNVFNTGVLWIDPFLRHLVLWLGFLGAMLATRQNRHIRIDVLTRFLTPKLKRFSAIVTHLFSAFVCYLLLSASVTFVHGEKEFGGVLPLFTDLPIWYVQAIIPIGFAVMMVRFTLKGVDQVIAVLRGLQPEEERS